MKKINQKNEFNRIQKFSIRKYSFGAASVAIATYLMFMGNGAVYAAQEGVTEATEPKAGEVVTPKEEQKAETLDKSALIRLIAEIETKLSDGKYDNKTDESLSLLKSAVESAKSTVVNATSQEELNKAYSSLATTVSSKLKNKPTEKKETQAVDTTNGKETVGKKQKTQKRNLIQTQSKTQVLKIHVMGKRWIKIMRSEQKQLLQRMKQQQTK